MDCQKIGSFIASRRKAQGLTQRELADQLYITDRAVSKWERGAGLPDISLLVTLSEALDISVGELLAGERIEVMSKQKTDEITASSVAAYSDRTRRRTWRKALVALPLALAILFAVTLGLGQVAKGALPSYSGLSNMAKTRALLRALDQDDEDALRDMLGGGALVSFGYESELMVSQTEADGERQVIIGFSVPVDAKTIDQKVYYVHFLTLGSENMNYRLKGFGYDDGNYYAEYELTFSDKNGNDTRGRLWAVWDGGKLTDLNLTVEGAGAQRAFIAVPPQEGD